MPPLTKPAAASLLFLNVIVSAADAQMVLVMEDDGSLTASRAQDKFARNYNDGVGQGSASDSLSVFGDAKEVTNVDVVSPVRSAPLPGAEVLTAIQTTALRYAAHPGLRRAGVSASNWLKLFRANIEIESAYRQSAVSSAGAIGLGQLMPTTARELGVNPHDLSQNLDGSARYLAQMLHEFGDPRLALAAYNAGPDAVRRHKGIPPYQETQNHVVRVMAAFKRLKGLTP